MTDDRSLERAARSWLEAGPTQAPDRAVEAALLRIETTSQERDLRILWRLPKMTTPARVAAAAVIGALAVGGAFFVLGKPGQSAVGGPGPSATPTAAAQTATPTAVSQTASPVAAASATPSLTVDHSDVPGRLLVQHLGNALDGSEVDSRNGHYERRRLYLMDPDGSNITEFLPGQPATGKTHADVSADQTKVTFQDSPATGASKIYEANLDGSGFRQISTACSCSEGEPAYSPDGRLIAFTRWTDGDTVSQIGIRDLATGTITMHPETKGVWPAGTSGDWAEHASWSPDGKTIVYALIRRDAGGKLVSSKLMSLTVASSAVKDIGVAETLGAGEPRYSPDGSLILFASRSAETSLGEAYGNVYTVHPDGTGLTRLTPARGGFDDGGTGASWTPDGKYIIYMWDRIRMMERDGSHDALWSASGPDMSSTERGYGYTTYWIPAP